MRRLSASRGGATSVLVSVAVISTACGLAPTAPHTASGVVVPSTPAVASRDAILQAHVDEWSAANDPVGVAAAVRFPDGELWVGSAGLSNRELGLPVDTAGRFEIASITKTFMSALTLRMAEEGLIDLDAPIAVQLPDFPSSEEITPRMLLGHRAGIFDPTSELVTDRFGPPDPERVFTPEELLEAAAAGTPTYRPGSRHDYSNAGYWVLAAVLEAVTDRDVGTLLNEYLINPLGLTETILFDSSLPDVEVVNAYMDLDQDGTPDPMGLRPLPGLVTPAWTAGGMISSARDVAEFLDALFNGRLLTDASLEAMLDGSSGGGNYALGIYRAGGRWGHDGGIAGYLSAAFHDPNSGVTVVVFTNRFGPDAPQADALAPTLASLANELAEAPAS